MDPRKVLIVLATLVPVISACNIQEKVERAVEEQVENAVSDALEDSGAPMIAQDIPQGYPLDEFPVYGGEDSDVLGGYRQSYEDMLAYNLVIGTGDPAEEVERVLRETYEERSSEFDPMSGSGMFTGTLGQWQYAIVVNDGEADGYAALVTYSLEEI